MTDHFADAGKPMPDALRLARMIEHYNAGVWSQRIVKDYQQAADELRRLYFENEKLRAALAEQPAEQESVQDEYNRVINHAIEQGIEASVFLRCWQEGYWSGCAEFGFEPNMAAYTAPQPRRHLTDEEIDNTTRKQVDDLLDHIYEYGTAAEGIDYRVRAIARAIERAHGIGDHE